MPYSIYPMNSFAVDLLFKEVLELQLQQQVSAIRPSLKGD